MFAHYCIRLVLQGSQCKVSVIVPDREIDKMWMTKLVRVEPLKVSLEHVWRWRRCVPEASPSPNASQHQPSFLSAFTSAIAYIIFGSPSEKSADNSLQIKQIPIGDMAEKELQQTIQQLHSLTPHNLSNASSLLSQAKLSLLKLNALVPTQQTSTQNLQLAREVLELGALISIRQKDPEAFTRYFQQLQPFYSLPAERWGGQDKGGNKSKVTGLHLLLLLSQGDYAGFHTVIESLEMAHGGKKRLDEDAFIQYPMRLEQALMEGSYDRVWGETKGERVPSEEFAVFSEVSCSIFQVVCFTKCSYVHRSLSTLSVPKSHLAASAHTHLYLSQTPRTYFSSTLKAQSFNLPILVAGLPKKGASTSLNRQRRWLKVKRTSLLPAARSLRTHLNTLGNWKPLCEMVGLHG